MVFERGDLARLARLERLQALDREVDRHLPRDDHPVAFDVGLGPGQERDDLEPPAPVGAEPPRRVEGDRPALVPREPGEQRVHPDPVFIPFLAGQRLEHPLAEEGREEDAAVGEDAMVLEQPFGPVVGEVGVDAEGVDQVEEPVLLREARPFRSIRRSGTGARSSAAATRRSRCRGRSRRTRPRSASGRKWRRTRPTPQPKSRTRLPSQSQSSGRMSSSICRCIRPEVS